MTLNDELRDLAAELVGTGWRDVYPGLGWTPEQRAAHDRWMDRMNRLDPGGHDQRLAQELGVMMSWPFKVVGYELHEANGHRWESPKYEPLSRSEIEADPDYAEHEDLQRWFDANRS